MSHPAVISCTCPVDCPIPHGIWFATGTAVGDPYPCRCTDHRACRFRRCPCAGRTDLDDLPARCCAEEGS